MIFKSGRFWRKERDYLTIEKEDICFTSEWNRTRMGGAKLPFLEGTREVVSSGITRLLFYKEGEQKI